MILALLPLFFLLFASSAFAATAEQWRGRSIYQFVHLKRLYAVNVSLMWTCSRVIVDRFALSAGTGKTQCDPAAQTWCGGTWNSLALHHYSLNCSMLSINHSKVRGKSWIIFRRQNLRLVSLVVVNRTSCTDGWLP